MIGYLGSLCLSLCGFPQSYQSYKSGNSEGISPTFLFLWTAGEILTLIYVWNSAKLLPLLLNYCSNLVFLSIIIYYKLFPRKL